ncbi:MAG: hypothetical protein HOY71_42680 [Nonomuraea sp.]|nr:hypothetical protein [Nonomuraea sp.]
MNVSDAQPGIDRQADAEILTVVAGNVPGADRAGRRLTEWLDSPERRFAATAALLIVAAVAVLVAGIRAVRTRRT